MTAKESVGGGGGDEKLRPLVCSPAAVITLREIGRIRGKTGSRWDQRVYGLGKAKGRERSARAGKQRRQSLATV